MSQETRGQLVVVGSGIKAVSHFTLEAQAHIQQADVVLYAAADPVTDMWIEAQNPCAFDLYQYYANDKNRIITYVQMTERILDEVRAGKRVCAVFYGHPGVFVTPSHNAIEIARREGYSARMLPAVSAEDCLYADLGVDPCVPGLQIFEATDLLLRQRRIDTTMNLMLWQVGCVGDLGFRFDGFVNNNFDVLVDYLIDVYGEDHQVVNYVASMFSLAEPTVETHRLGALRDPEVARTVTGISTFFIRPTEVAQSDDAAGARLGLRVGPSRGTPLVCDRADYPAMAAVARRNNQEHRVPDGYKFSHASPALYETMYALALDIDAEQAFKADPDAFLSGREGLTETDRRYLRMRHLGVIRMMFKADPAKEAARFVDAALRRPYLADSYRAVVQVERAARGRGETTTAEYHAAITEWLRARGFATSAPAVSAAIRNVRFVRADSTAPDPQPTALVAAS